MGMTVAQVIREFYEVAYDEGAEIEVFETDEESAFGFSVESAEEIYGNRKVGRHWYDEQTDTIKMYMAVPRERQELYRACKYEAQEYFADHGCNLADMWALVNGRYKGMEHTQMFWIKLCLEDYREEIGA